MKSQREKNVIPAKAGIQFLKTKSKFCLFVFIFTSFSFCTYAEYVDRTLLWIKNLEHELPLIRKNSAFYLGKLREKRAVKPLLKALDDDNQTVKIQVIKSLGLIGEYSIMDELRRMYGRENEEVRKILLAVIGRLEKIKERDMKQVDK